MVVNLSDLREDTVAKDGELPDRSLVKPVAPRDAHGDSCILQ